MSNPSHIPQRLPVIVAGSRVPKIGPRLVSAYDMAWRQLHPYLWRAANRRARTTFHAQRPQLRPAQIAMLEALRTRGIATAPLADIVDPALWPRVAAEAAAWLQQPHVVRREQEFREGGFKNARKKEFIIRMFGDGAYIPLESIWMQLALRPEILDIVNSYLGLTSVLQYLDVWNTIAIGQPQKFTGSQNWHRDPEDTRIVKAFLYLSDIDEGAGPMHYVPHSRPGERFGHLWPQRFPDGSYPPSADFEREVPRSEWAVCAHPAGTLVLADTVGFHMGGRATTRNRVLSTWCYATPGSAWGRGFRTDTVDASSALPVASRAALA